jgi:hypothetical protein
MPSWSGWGVRLVPTNEFLEGYDVRFYALGVERGWDGYIHAANEFENYAFPCPRSRAGRCDIRSSLWGLRLGLGSFYALLVGPGIATEASGRFTPMCPSFHALESGGGCERCHSLVPLTCGFAGHRARPLGMVPRNGSKRVLAGARACELRVMCVNRDRFDRFRAPLYRSGQ